MLTTRFGIEIEFTGITREKAANVAAEYLNGTVERTYDSYDSYKVYMADGRYWKFMHDNSIHCQRKSSGQIMSADGFYSVEMVSPILTYKEDIETLQELARRMRKAGGFCPDGTGIHVHLDGAGHTIRSLKNFINTMASKGDLLYDALQVEESRKQYCHLMDSKLIEKIKDRKPTSLSQLETIWYEGFYGGTHVHYHQSRYAILNLHSFFNGVGTVELRAFNSTLHAGEIRAYVVLALALNHQALNQKYVSANKPQVENKKFAMRTFLCRLGLNGDDFASCRDHLTKHLPGCAAWRFKVAC